jgi:hypothetical protein
MVIFEHFLNECPKYAPTCFCQTTNRRRVIYRQKFSNWKHNNKEVSNLFFSDKTTKIKITFYLENWYMGPESCTTASFSQRIVMGNSFKHRRYALLRSTPRNLTTFIDLFYSENQVQMRSRSFTLARLFERRENSMYIF